MRHVVRVASVILVAGRLASADVADDACAKSTDGAACLASGRHHEDTDATLATAVHDYQRACDLGTLQGCAELARIYDWGWTWLGVTRDIDRALALDRKACDGGYAPACDDLGLLMLSGQDVKHDPAEAVRLFRKACDGKAMHGCTSLGYVYETGVPLARDLGQARALYLQACDGGDYQGCDNTALLDERASPPATADALIFFDRGCALHSGFGCKRAGNAYRAAKKPRQASERYRSSCLLHDSDACSAWCALNPGPSSCMDRLNPRRQ